MRKRQLTARLASALFAIVLGLGLVAHAQNVTSEHLLKGLADPGTWLNYGGDYGSQRHSPLTQVTPTNVDQLSVQWAFQTSQLGKFELLVYTEPSSAISTSRVNVR